MLVVEDQHLVALEIAETLEAAGCAVVGPVPTVSRALELAARQRLDAAILDVNLRGEPAWPVAEELRDRDVPFVFATGYAQSMKTPRTLTSAPHVSKPVDHGKLVAALRSVL